MSDPEVQATGDASSEFQGVNTPATEKTGEPDAVVPKAEPQGDNAGSTDGVVSQNEALAEKASNGEAQAGAPASSPVKQAVKATSDVARKGLSAVKIHAAPSTGKTNAPKTPLVKKIINSGTFGSGAVKPAPTAPKSNSTSAIAKPAAAASIKKSTSAISTDSKPSSTDKKPSAIATKTMPPRTGSTTGLSSSQSSAARRPSVPPKPPLSGSNARRPESPAPGRASVISPAGSVSSGNTRPRASVSDGVPNRRTSVGPRSNVPVTAKPNVTSGPRRQGTLGSSISSLREVKEESSTANSAFTQKLSEAQAEIRSKDSQIRDLGSRIEQLQSSLSEATADAQAKQSLVDELRQAKDTLESQLAAVQAEVSSMQDESKETTSQLVQVQEELELARQDITSGNDQLLELQNQVEAVSKELSQAKENLSAARIANEADATAAISAAEADRDALSKVTAQLEALRSEYESFKVGHAAELEQSKKENQTLEAQLAQSSSLVKELEELRKQREDSASKISELEVEILELREVAEKAEDAQTAAEEKVKSLDDSLAKANASIQQALSDAQDKEAVHAKELEEARHLHQQVLQNAAEEQAQLQSQFTSLEEHLKAAISRHEQTISDSQQAEEEHKRVLAETEATLKEKHAMLEADIQRINKELEGQEAQYAAKVDAVKAEHDLLLQQAFEKAKAEASDAHSQDLQALRNQSQAAIDQLRAGHQTSLDSLKAEHQAALGSQVKTLEKTISNQALELKATQEDLQKAKSAYATSLSELESLRVQLEEFARSTENSAAASSAEHSVEIQRLTKELSAAHDDNKALNEVLALTKDSLNEISRNHKDELQDAARTRVEEVTKLRAEHDEQHAALLKEKEALSTQITDLQGEISTLRATAAAAAERPKSPKSNGLSYARHTSVTAEELQQMHEAHNLKLHDLEANQEKALLSLREDLHRAEARVEELQNEVNRKTMEIQYLEQDGEEKDDTITRLKDDLAKLSEK